MLWNAWLLGALSRRLSAPSKNSTAGFTRPNDVPGAALDMRRARIYAATPWRDTEAAAFYCISPIRVTDPNTHGNPIEFLHTGDALNERLNRTMQNSLWTPLRPQTDSDSLYIRANRGKN